MEGALNKAVVFVGAAASAVAVVDSEYPVLMLVPEAAVAAVVSGTKLNV
jgi:hypothetical protein